MLFVGISMVFLERFLFIKRLGKVILYATKHCLDNFSKLFCLMFPYFVSPIIGDKKYGIIIQKNLLKIV